VAKETVNSNIGEYSHQQQVIPQQPPQQQPLQQLPHQKPVQSQLDIRNNTVAERRQQEQYIPPQFQTQVAPHSANRPGIIQQSKVPRPNVYNNNQQVGLNNKPITPYSPQSPDKINSPLKAAASPNELFYSEQVKKHLPLLPNGQVQTHPITFLTPYRKEWFEFLLHFIFNPNK
jgi:hypothetical protein